MHITKIFDTVHITLVFRRFLLKTHGLTLTFDRNPNFQGLILSGVYFEQTKDFITLAKNIKQLHELPEVGQVNIKLFLAVGESQTVNLALLLRKEIVQFSFLSLDRSEIISKYNLKVIPLNSLLEALEEIYSKYLS